MRKKLITFLMAALTALAMMAAPAAAHPHAQAANGFIGPNPAGPGAVAHNGIQCAVDANKNILPLPAGAPLSVECPADR